LGAKASDKISNKKFGAWRAEGEAEASAVVHVGELAVAQAGILLRADLVGYQHTPRHTAISSQKKAGTLLSTDIQFKNIRE